MNPSNYKILLVDDEDDVLEFLSYNLRKEGFKVSTASNGTDGVVKAIEELPHLIILDVMMPEMDGMATCAKIREISALKNSLIIFLTARAEDYSQIAGFDAGADDYVTKPIKPKLLISRVKALLRRVQDNEQEATTLAIKDFIIDSDRFLVINNGVEIVLPKKEFELLRLFASRPNKVFTREEIFAKIWGADVIVGDRTIDVHVRKIREKIGIESIRTVKGVGYKFEV
ncbi:MAG: response regulator transcription factor [Bacteroidales bacterium]|jgi:two-component system alkaline phosphatase synthesis response regulator PhoP|nr:response regulator transcription factor [Bacteroidales bacterium]